MLSPFASISSCTTVLVKISGCGCAGGWIGLSSGGRARSPSISTEERSAANAFVPRRFEPAKGGKGAAPTSKGGAALLVMKLRKASPRELTSSSSQRSGCTQLLTECSRGANVSQAPPENPCRLGSAKSVGSPRPGRLASCCSDQASMARPSRAPKLAGGAGAEDRLERRKIKPTWIRNTSAML